MGLSISDWGYPFCYLFSFSDYRIYKKIPVSRAVCPPVFHCLSRRMHRRHAQFLFASPLCSVELEYPLASSSAFYSFHRFLFQKILLVDSLVSCRKFRTFVLFFVGMALDSARTEPCIYPVYPLFMGCFGIASGKIKK